MCARYPLWKMLLPEKLAKVHARSPDLSPIDRPYTSFYRHCVVTLVLGRFISEIIARFVSQMALLHIPILFQQKFGDVPPSPRWMTSAVQ